jgi:hypothetical protein
MKEKRQDVRACVEAAPVPGDWEAKITGWVGGERARWEREQEEAARAAELDDY